MSFTDYLFMPLFVVVALLYYIIPKKIRWFYLLIVSVAFYCTWNADVLPYILTAVTVAWISGLLIERNYQKLQNHLDSKPDMSKEEKKVLQSKAKKWCKCILLVSAAVLIGMLVFGKAGKHILKALDLSDVMTVVMPLGISYYTMSLVGYMADVYWKKEKAEKNILKLLLFAIYFPKILEGPISKHRLIAAQLNESCDFDYNTFCFGLQRMIWGYFKKLVIVSVFLSHRYLQSISTTMGLFYYWLFCLVYFSYIVIFRAVWILL